MATDTVDWDAYAAAYDLMAKHNPAYQEIVALLSCRSTRSAATAGGTTSR